MKIMSFNTQHCKNFITKEIDFQVMAEAIRQCGAEIVALNEMYNQGEDPTFQDQVAELAKLTDMPYYYFAKAIDVGGNNPYGNGFLSKYPLESVETVKIPDPEVRAYKRYYETRCLLKAKIEGGLTVLVTHFGLNPDEQENAVRTVLANLTDEKCILMGDFNVSPDAEVLRPIRERMTDAADAFDEPKLSFPSDTPRVKIDYIFVSPDIKVTASDIPAIVASDHRPHTAEITW